MFFLYVENRDSSFPPFVETLPRLQQGLHCPPCVLHLQNQCKTQLQSKTKRHRNAICVRPPPLLSVPDNLTFSRAANISYTSNPSVVGVLNIVTRFNPD